MKGTNKRPTSEPLIVTLTILLCYLYVLKLRLYSSSQLSLVCFMLLNSTISLSFFTKRESHTKYIKEGIQRIQI